MPVDFTAGPEGGGETNASEGPMVAPIPAWDRKRRGQRRSFFSDQPADPAMTEAGAGAATGATASDTSFAETPIYADRRTRTARSSGSAVPIAIVAGLVVLAGVAAAGWYASQPHDQGVAQLTPGGPAAPAATDAAAPATGPAMAQNTAAPPIPPPAESAARARPHAVVNPAPARHRATATARSRSVEDVGVNASATVPTPTPAPQAAPVVPPPSAAAPAPAPTPTAPTVNPANPPAETTPPTQPSTPPQLTSPTPPPDQPPPQ